MINDRDLIPDYHDAYRCAVELSRRLNLDVAIRGVNWFGKKGFAVCLAEPFGSCSKYRAEIVTPKSPITWEE